MKAFDHKITLIHGRVQYSFTINYSTKTNVVALVIVGHLVDLGILSLEDEAVSDILKSQHPMRDLRLLLNVRGWVFLGI